MVNKDGEGQEILVISTLLGTFMNFFRDLSYDMYSWPVIDAADQLA